MELDREISEKFGRLHREAMTGLHAAQERFLDYMERLATYFERQYFDAVTSLMRRWKLYDGRLMIRFEWEATTANFYLQPGQP